ncbi:MAG: hypothetical protein J4432_03600 [DPANN group archaeon]|nr:hypothetical protein [DPANN group archaeon]
MPSENRIIEEAARGATKGALEFTEEKIKQYAKRFLNKEVGFIEDTEIIDLVKAQRKRPELTFLRKYVKNPEHLLQIQMGYTLRKLEENKDAQGLQKLRQALLKRYGKRGLHVAQLAQRGILNKSFFQVAGLSENDAELEEVFTEFLENTDKYFIFIQATDNPLRLKNTINARLETGMPQIMVIFSKGKPAMGNAKSLVQLLKKSLNIDYAFERYEDNSQQYDFIMRKTTYPNLS